MYSIPSQKEIENNIRIYPPTEQVARETRNGIIPLPLRDLCCCYDPPVSSAPRPDRSPVLQECQKPVRARREVHVLQPKAGCPGVAPPGNVGAGRRNDQAAVPPDVYAT